MISMLTALAVVAGAQLSQAGPAIHRDLPPDIDPRFVVGDMRTAGGADLGVAIVTAAGRVADATLRVELRAGALKPGRYEVFVQDKAACAAPAKLTPQGAFQAPKSGRVYAQFSSAQIDITNIAGAPLLDADGAAVVIQNGGRRIACAEIRG